MKLPEMSFSVGFKKAWQPAILSAGLLMAWSFSAEQAAAQTQRATGSTGGSSAPRNSSGSSFGGSSAPGLSGSLSGTGGTGGGFGGSALSGIGAGMSSFGQQQATGAAAGGFVGQNFGTGQFVGQANAAGGAQNGQRNAQGGANRGAVDRNISQMLNGGGMGGNFNNGGGMGGGGTSQQIPIRPQQRIAFDFPKPPANQLLMSAQTRFAKLSARQPQLAGLGISVSTDGVATLTGQVASENQKKLAEQLLRLEPGIRNVQNELQFPTP